jgi:hypothetical protein
MTIDDMLINNASRHRVISFLDGNAGYNQIFMTEEDIPKMAFRCPGFIGLFEWILMTLHHRRGCHNWGCFDANNREQGTHHYILQPVSHQC